jgi:hypothetical protein
MERLLAWAGADVGYVIGPGERKNRSEIEELLMRNRQ